MTHTSTKSKNSATIGFEATLWQAADKLRSSMELEAGLGELITIKQPGTPTQHDVIQTAQQ